MPYRTKQDLPDGVKNDLPAHAYGSVAKFLTKSGTLAGEEKNRR